MRLLLTLCTLLLPSVMGMHKLQRLHDTALETAGTEAQALVQARALATTMEQEMFQHLLSTSNQQELAVDAVYNEKRIGIEVEFQGIPRMVVAVKATKIAEMKAAFAGGGHYEALGAAKWLHAAVVPLTYGNTWLETARDGQGIHHWKCMTDNEHNHPHADSKSFWKRVMAKAMNTKYGTPLGEAEDLALESLSRDCGLNAAMEIVTSPLETKDDNFGTTPNYVYALQAMRQWVKTLRRYTYKTANGGGDGGLATDALLASNLPSDDAKKVFCHALGGDTTDLNKVQGKWRGQAHMVVVPFLTVANQFNADLVGLPGFAGIDAYRFTKQNPEYFLLQPRVDFMFSTVAAQPTFYERYFVFPLQATGGGDTDTPMEILQHFRLGPQLNFGFPVSKFAAEPATTINELQVAQNYPHPPNGYWPFTARIYPWVRTYGLRLYESALADDKVQHPRGNAPNPPNELTAWQANDAKGFFVLLLHYYFIDGYLGLKTKFAHSLLLKSPINDVLRALHWKSRRVVASWWDAMKSTRKAFNKLEKACSSIWSKSHVEDIGYAKPNVALREQAAKDLIDDILLSVTTNNAPTTRWKHERARVINHRWIIPDVVTTSTRYGRLNAGNNDEHPYPDGHDAVTTIAKTVPPFIITDINGNARPAVLMEHRDGNKISFKFGDVWNPIAVSRDALATELHARIALLAGIQTPVLLEQQSRVGTPEPIIEELESKPQVVQEVKLWKNVVNTMLKKKHLDVELDDTPLSTISEKFTEKDADAQKDLSKLLSDIEQAVFDLDPKDKEEETLIRDEKETGSIHEKECKSWLEKQSKKEKLTEEEEEELQNDCAAKY